MAPPVQQLTKEERQKRIIESRQMFGRRRPRRSRSLEQLAPRQSIALGVVGEAPHIQKPAKSSFVPTRPVPFKLSGAGDRDRKKISVLTRGTAAAEEEFKIDHKSLEMIESGNVVIPPPARPSLFNRPRNTIGFQMNRFRPSMAPVEPRTSLLPLGINVFDANEAEKALVSEFLRQKCEAMTPKAQKHTTDLHKSIQKVRFQESPKEGSDEKKEVPVATPYVSKFDNNGSFMPPTEIRSALKNARYHYNRFDATPIPAARKLNFEDSTLEDSKIEKENQSSSTLVDDLDFMSQIRKIAEFDVTTLQNRQFTPEEKHSIEKVAEILNKIKANYEKPAEPSKPQMMRQQLVPISENEDDEEAEEEEEGKTADDKTLTPAFAALNIKSKYSQLRLPDF